MRSIESLGAYALYERLLRIYGQQSWWPAETPLEVVIGAVLTQNTAWHNVTMAIENLRTMGLLDLEPLMTASPEQVKDAIRSSGFYNIKYDRLMNVLRFVADQGGLNRIEAMPLETIRPELLSVRGVGPETADSILLYALEKPIFVVDAYTRRLLSRLGHAWASRATYDELQAWFMQALPPIVSLYNAYHALIVTHCKTHCRKTPQCTGCGLAEPCQWNGQMNTES